MIINIPLPNLLLGSDFLRFLLMKCFKFASVKRIDILRIDFILLWFPVHVRSRMRVFANRRVVRLVSVL